MRFPFVVRSRRASLLGLLVTACAAPVPPAIFAQVVSVRTSPASLEAAEWAPQARAHALGLEERAQDALADGDATAAEVLAETALAAHERARALTRRARAEQRRADAEARLEQEQQALAELHAQHQRLTAEAAALELRARVLRDAIPLPELDQASPERRLARRHAAAALATQARLLCLAAGLLDEHVPAQETQGALDALDAQLSAGTGHRVLEEATRLRSQCLSTLSGVRRESTPGALLEPAPGAPEERGLPADVLLAELSDAGDEPSRDDRGISVVLRDAFGGDASLNEPGGQKLEHLARVARAHPAFPLLLVGHAGAPRQSAQVDRRLSAVVARLESLGIARVDSHNAGLRQPLLPRGTPRSKETNERVELVFVAPGL